MLAVLAVTAGSLGLSSSAFATSPAATTAAGARPHVVTMSIEPATVMVEPVIVEPVIVYASDAGQNIVELTPSGALVIFVRVVKFVPVVRHEVFIVRPKLKVVTAVTAVTPKTLTITKSARTGTPGCSSTAGGPETRTQGPARTGGSVTVGMAVLIRNDGFSGPKHTVHGTALAFAA